MFIFSGEEERAGERGRVCSRRARFSRKGFAEEIPVYSRRSRPHLIGVHSSQEGVRPAFIAVVRLLHFLHRNRESTACLLHRFRGVRPAVRCIKCCTNFEVKGLLYDTFNSAQISRCTAEGFCCTDCSLNCTEIEETVRLGLLYGLLSIGTKIEEVYGLSKLYQCI